MLEHTTNVGITHIWPYSKLVNPEAQPFSDECEADVWDELRDVTFDEEVRGKVCVALHASYHHDAFAGDFKRDLLRDDFVSNRVAFYKPRENEYRVQRAATPARTIKPLRSVAEAFKLVDGEFVEQSDTSAPIVVPAQPARDEKVTRIIPFHLGSRADAQFVVKQFTGHEICALVLWYPDESLHLKYLSYVRANCPDLPIYIFHCDHRADKYGIEREGGSWRKDVSTFVELSEDKPEMLIEHLIPEKALTVMAAPSYTGKTHIAIEVGLALATGSDFLGHFKGPKQPVPVIYHVPELHASLFRNFMQRLGAEERLRGCLDNFLIRPLERDLWPLDSPQMIDSSRGRYVFLDTFGYFNDGDDSASYTQAIEFAKKINNLIREGCLGVCGLYHPPKYSKDKKTTGNVMTLENQILGSAGYGGVLRSCLGMRNLHEDSNKGLWVYVQGVKNPGLEGPFQIEGVPLRLVKKPGESPYLSELLKSGSKQEQAMAMHKEGKTRDEICKTLKISSKTFTKYKQEGLEFDSDEDKHEGATA